MKNFCLFIALMILLSSASEPVLPQSVNVSDIEIIHRHVLDDAGFSASLEISPVDGRLHLMWVNQGNMRYLIRDNDAGFGTAQILNDGGNYVYSEEGENRWPRKCVDLAIDPSGVSHIVFSVQNGDVYYMSGNPDFGGEGQWSQPVRIAQRPRSSIYPNIEYVNGDLYVIFEDAEKKELFDVRRIEGHWSDVRFIDWGDYPQMTLGENGMIYLMYRFFQWGAPDYYAHNPVFAYMVPGYTEWIKIDDFASRAGRRSGIGPYMTVGNGRIYLAWNNCTGIAGPQKAELFCAFAPEPGLDWTNSMTGGTPLYFENTGDPHVRVQVYSDSTLLYFNSRRLLQRFMVYSQNAWSGPFDLHDETQAFFNEKMWFPGITFADNDGRTVWIVSSSSREESNLVTLNGLVNPHAQIYDWNNNKPDFTTFPDTIIAPGMQWAYHANTVDEDGDSVIYSLTLPVEGMSIHPVTGAAEWLPGENQKGRHLAGIKADDQSGGWSVQYFWLTVGSIDVDFSANPVSGQAPLDVQFTDESGNSLSAWQWDFGNGETSTEKNPLHTYTEPGIYTVKLSGTGYTGAGERIRNDYIHIYAPPVVPSFTAEPASGLIPLTVHFTDESTGEITERRWDFGDGNTSAEKNPAHTYQNSGYYSVSLHVRGQNGDSTLIKENYIYAYAFASEALFSGNPVSGTAPLEVQFTDSSKGNIDSWSWIFGDGNTAQEQNPLHVYQAPGIYTVSLTVSGLSGADTLIYENYIHAQWPEAPFVNFSATPLAGEAPLQVQFTDESSGDVHKWGWNFGDTFTEEGGFSDEQHPVYTYENPGTYTVRLRIYGEGFVFSEEKEDYITVSAQTSVETDGASVPVFALLPNYPNPFNPQTIIPFQVGRQSRVNISIYDLLGRKVKTLVDAVFSAGRHQTLWDGSDMTGKDAANGIYFYIMRADNFKSARKAFLLK